MVCAPTVARQTLTKSSRAPVRSQPQGNGRFGPPAHEPKCTQVAIMQWCFCLSPREVAQTPVNKESGGNQGKTTLKISITEAAPLVEDTGGSHQDFGIEVENGYQDGESTNGGLPIRPNPGSVQPASGTPRPTGPPREDGRMSGVGGVSETTEKGFKLPPPSSLPPWEGKKTPPPLEWGW